MKLLYFGAGLLTGLTIWAGAYYVQRSSNQRAELIYRQTGISVAFFQFGTLEKCREFMHEPIAEKNYERAFCLPLSDPDRLRLRMRPHREAMRLAQNSHRAAQVASPVALPPARALPDVVDAD